MTNNLKELTAKHRAECRENFDTGFVMGGIFASSLLGLIALLA